MSKSLSDSQLEQFSDWLTTRIGVLFPRERRRELEDAIGKCATALGFEDPASCAHQLPVSLLSRHQIEILASHLTVGETYFFRDKASFDTVERHVLPELIHARRSTDRRLRIWSAGCSTGEEPYSLAMLLTKMIPDIHDWNVLILATDINPRALQQASLGVYTNWSFRQAPPHVKEAFFHETKKGHFEVIPRIKQMVTFAHLNLAEDIYPSVINNTCAMDIIFCRNVLMYFEPGSGKKLVRRLALSLTEGGWLFVSPVESSFVDLPVLVHVNFPGAIVYRNQISRSDVLLPSPATRERSWGRGQATVTISPPSPSPQPLSHKVGEGLPVVQAQPDAKSMAVLARTFANQRQLDVAGEWCEKAIAADRLNPGWCYLLASIRQEQDQIENAIKALRRALYLDPDYALAYVALGQLAWRRCEHTQAKRHFSNALSILEGYQQEELLPESDGITAGRLAEIIRSTMTSSNYAGSKGSELASMLPCRAHSPLHRAAVSQAESMLSETPAQPPNASSARGRGKSC